VGPGGGGGGGGGDGGGVGGGGGGGGDGRGGGGCEGGRGAGRGCGSRMAEPGSATHPSRSAAGKRPTRPRPRPHPAQVATKPLMSIPSKAGAKRSHASIFTVSPWQCPSSAPVPPPQGAPGGSGRVDSPSGRGRPTKRPSKYSHSKYSHSKHSLLSAQPLPRLLALAAVKIADFTAVDYAGTPRSSPIYALATRWCACASQDRTTTPPSRRSSPSSPPCQ